MKFRTEYIPDNCYGILTPEKPVVLAGSCFSQNICEKMRSHMWEASNPGGTLYNPLSIVIALRMLNAGDKGVKDFENSLFHYNDVWSSRFFDSSFSSRDKTDSIAEFKQRQADFQNKISKGGVLIVTFGTSICYFYKEDEKAAGNCHKQPASLFYTRRLEIKEISDLWTQFIHDIRLQFPDLKFIFTVSPVRHLKNGFTGNSRSKAVLQLAVEEICSQNDGCHYFPAFEIFNDDLRDYRFYASDLVHPSEEGIEYVWDKFIATYLNEEALQLLKEGGREFRRNCHRPLTGALGKTLAQ